MILGMATERGRVALFTFQSNDSSRGPRPGSVPEDGLKHSLWILLFRYTALDVWCWVWLPLEGVPCLMVGPPIILRAWGRWMKLGLTSSERRVALYGFQLMILRALL